MATQAKYYAISKGDGNDGINHMFPGYIVKTSDPWRLARLASIGEFKEGEGWKWAKKHVMIDGEAEYNIQGCFLEGPDGETAVGAAWMLVDVFPADEDTVRSWQEDDYKLVYESLEECFGAKLLAFVPD